MLKYGFFAVLSIILLTTHASTIRILQYNDPLCAVYNTDGTVCLQCILRAYYDPVSEVCRKVNDECATWNLTNGQCITCFPGYGDAPIDGKAINGECPVYDSSGSYDQNCKVFMAQNQCQECFEGFYPDPSMRCVALPPGCMTV